MIMGFAIIVLAFLLVTFVFAIFEKLGDKPWKRYTPSAFLLLFGLLMLAKGIFGFLGDRFVYAKGMMIPAYGAIGCGVLSLIAGVICIYHTYNDKR